MDTCLTSIFSDHFLLHLPCWVLSFSFPVPDVVLVLLALALNILTPYVVTVHMRCSDSIQPQSHLQSLGSTAHKSPAVFTSPLWCFGHA